MLMPYSNPEQPPGSIKILKIFPDSEEAFISLTFDKAESVNFIIYKTLCAVGWKSIHWVCSEIYAKKEKMVIFVKSFLEAVIVSK